MDHVGIGALVGGFLPLRVVYFRFWCRYLCPAGAFLALFNRIALLRKWAPLPIPGKCDLGVTFADDVDCIRCHRCLYEVKGHQSTSDDRKSGHVFMSMGFRGRNPLARKGDSPEPQGTD